MPWGRGGAGNFAFNEQVKQQNEHKAQDLEAQHAAPSAASGSGAQNASTSMRSQQEYAHMGRGGAGNWYQPTELEKEGKFNQSADGDATAVPTSEKPQISTPWHPEGTELPVARKGRGGAGNFVWKGDRTDGTKGEAEGKIREEVEKRIVEDVDTGLQKPPGAVLGNGKAGRGW